MSRPGLEPTLCADQTPELESGAPTLGHETPQIKSQSFKPQNGFGPTGIRKIGRFGPREFFDHTIIITHELTTILDKHTAYKVVHARN